MDVEELLKTEFARARAEGQQQGFQEGLSRAQTEIETKVETLRQQLSAEFEERDKARAQRVGASVSTLNTALERQRELLDQRIASIEEQGIALAFEALCKILGDTARKRETLQATISNALSKLRDGRIQKLVLHSSDMQLVMDSEPSSWLPVPLEALQLVADDSLPPGSCILESAGLSLDISLGTQLARVQEVWLASVMVAKPGEGAP
ncbi:MAG TPA: FliH/SctL family protein [Burkholderiaceae bacterium]